MIPEPVPNAPAKSSEQQNEAPPTVTRPLSQTGDHAPNLASAPAAGQANQQASGGQAHHIVTAPTQDFFFKRTHSYCKCGFNCLQMWL